MIVGRKKELSLLENAYRSSEPEFIVVYGRRRVGKTFLIREYFKNLRCLFFHATGLQKGTMKKQLKKFTEAISETFYDKAPLESPKGWDEALNIVHKQIVKTKRKVVIFLDEIPWMATKKSGLLEEIDYYWNQHWSHLPNVILILCGSSASWLIKKVIHNRGGLHNRVTCQIRLSPFTLSETKAYLKTRRIKLNDWHIVSLYMALGGIPYYLRYVKPNITAEQNIQKIIFDDDAPLKEEFDMLFRSLFKEADAYIELIRIMARKKEGVERGDIESSAHLSSSGGRLTQRLKDLCDTGFIQITIPWGRSKGEYYKLMDEYVLFFLTWVDSEKRGKFMKNHWVTQSQKPSYVVWAGYAFEALCMKHIDEIITALHIDVGGTIGSWRFVSKNREENGAQVDLVINRNDNAITLCEIKYSEEPYVIHKEYAKKLQQKIEVFKKSTKTEKQVFLSMICANGLKQNMYSEELISGVATLKDLFN